MFGVRRRAAAALAGAGIALGLLSGCVASAPKPTPKPTPSATALFRSEEEALAAAKASYQRYLDVSNQVGRNGWVDLTPLETVEAAKVLSDDRSVGKRYLANSFRQVGDLTFDRLRVQNIGVTKLTAYVCLDASNAQLVDASGTDQRNANFRPRVPLQIAFEQVKGSLLLVESNLWSGKSFC